MNSRAFASNGSQEPCNKQDPAMHRAVMAMLSIVEAQRSLANLLRLAEREGCGTIGLDEIAEMIDGMAERFDIAFCPFRHLHHQTTLASQSSEARK